MYFQQLTYWVECKNRRKQISASMLLLSSEMKWNSFFILWIINEAVININTRDVGYLSLYPFCTSVLVEDNHGCIVPKVRKASHFLVGIWALGNQRSKALEGRWGSGNHWRIIIGDSGNLQWTGWIEKLTASFLSPHMEKTKYVHIRL